MNIIQLYQDFSIDFATEEQKHCCPGWINTPCPFCTGNPGYHLGYNMDEDYFHCWRCGGHPVKKVLSKLLNIHEKEIPALIIQYGGRVLQIHQKSPPKSSKPFQLPTGCVPLAPSHRQYLSHRGYNADQLEQEWNLVSTGPISQLDGISYKHRIIAPIYWDGQQVSFQGRDATNKHAKKYMACPKDRELIHHKEILYGKQSAWGSTGVCVEGITDVWRFGNQSFATFGIKYTQKQLRLIANSFKRVAVIFDDEIQAIEQAYKLVSELEYRRVEAFQIPIVGDPGGMEQSEADYLIKQILK